MNQLLTKYITLFCVFVYIPLYGFSKVILELGLGRVKKYKNELKSDEFPSM